MASGEVKGSIIHCIIVTNQQSPAMMHDCVRHIMPSVSSVPFGLLGLLLYGVHVCGQQLSPIPDRWKQYDLLSVTLGACVVQLNS